MAILTTSSATSRTVKRRFPQITSWTLSTRYGGSSRPRVFTDWCSTLFEMLKPFVALHTTHTFLPVNLLQWFKFFHKRFPKFEAEFHTHALFLKLLQTWIRQMCDSPAHIWGCSSTNNACSGMWETAVCCQNLPLRNHNSYILLTMAICTPSAKFGLFLNIPHTSYEGN